MFAKVWAGTLRDKTALPEETARPMLFELVSMPEIRQRNFRNLANRRSDDVLDWLIILRDTVVRANFLFNFGKPGVNCLQSQS